MSQDEDLIFRRKCREIALRMSEVMNPSEFSANTQSPQSGRTKPSVDKVLSDADKIYDWLTKEI